METVKTLAELIPELTRKPRLIIVDDQPLIIRVLNEIFKTEFEVYMATNGQQALDMCHVHNPDIMLLDVMMPDISGYEVCQQLKADGALKNFPVIFVTAQQDVLDEVRAFNLGAVDFITKPINPLLVTARVRTHVTVKLQRDMLHSIAMRDALTGIANRRNFDEQLQVHWRQGQRDTKPLSLIMIDIDCFKQYNDEYGHQAGDQVLCHVAQTLASVLHRPHDSVSRYGGEEFVCLLPGTDSTGACTVAQHLVNAVASLAIPHAGSSVTDWLTISAGGATIIPSAGQAASQLVSAADAQLYLVKGQGRNHFQTVDLGISAE